MSNTGMKITAKWARETAETVLGNKVILEIEACNDEIQCAVKENKMSCIVRPHLENLTKEHLINNGFKVKEVPGYNQLEPDYTEISW